MQRENFARLQVLLIEEVGCRAFQHPHVVDMKFQKIAGNDEGCSNTKSFGCTSAKASTSKSEQNACAYCLSKDVWREFCQLVLGLAATFRRAVSCARYALRAAGALQLSLLPFSNFTRAKGCEVLVSFATEFCATTKSKNAHKKSACTGQALRSAGCVTLSAVRAR